MHGALLSLLALVPAAVFAGPIQRRAPIIEAKMGKAIPSKYVVKLKDSADAAALAETISADRVYEAKGFKGFAGTIDAETLETLQLTADVEYIEEDAEFFIADYVTQSGAPWGLGRISSRETGSTDYTYDESAGEGTCSYIIDTGIYTAHSDFGGRAFWMGNYIDSSNSDGNGHGTHVAGTVGGTTYGVAKKTTLYAVKVLSASGGGTTSSVIAGMNAVTASTHTCPKGKVANMSLSGGFSTSINAAARAMVEAGIFLAVAAANNNANAANYSPASEPMVCTVGASDSADRKASFSNYGAVVDIFAPGVSVLSAWIGGTSATNSISGTSMASPHVAGLGAYFLGTGAATAEDMCDYMVSISTSGAITGLPSGTANLLAFNGSPE